MKLIYKQIASAVLLLVVGILGGNVAPPILPKPSPEPSPVVKSQPEAFITTKDGKRIVCKPLEDIAATLEDGKYEVLGIPKAGDPFVRRVVIVGSEGITPVVPPAPPEPVPTPTVKGPREIVILRERDDDSADLARELNALRVGQHAEYLAANKHDLYILDDDTNRPDNTPDPYVQALLGMRGGVALPCVFVIDKSANKILDVKPFATAAGCIEALKAKGG